MNCTLLSCIHVCYTVHRIATVFPTLHRYCKYLTVLHQLKFVSFEMYISSPEE